jgi:hypothetical protein
MNRRLNLRIRLPLTGELTVGSDRSHNIEVGDISLAGARVSYVPRAEEVGKNCFLTLFAQDDAMLISATLYGRVVYGGGHDCAIRFEAVDTQDFDLLAQLLSKHGAEPAAIQQEIKCGFTPQIKEWESVCTSVA